MGNTEGYDAYAIKKVVHERLGVSVQDWVRIGIYSSWRWLEYSSSIIYFDDKSDQTKASNLSELLGSEIRLTVQCYDEKSIVFIPDRDHGLKNLRNKSNGKNPPEGCYFEVIRNVCTMISSKDNRFFKFVLKQYILMEQDANESRVGIFQLKNHFVFGRIPTCGRARSHISSVLSWEENFN